MTGHGEQAAEVLEFWFVQSRPRQWFAKDPDGAYQESCPLVVLL